MEQNRKLNGIEVECLKQEDKLKKNLMLKRSRVSGWIKDRGRSKTSMLKRTPKTRIKRVQVRGKGKDTRLRRSQVANPRRMRSCHKDRLLREKWKAKTRWRPGADCHQDKKMKKEKSRSRMDRKILKYMTPPRRMTPWGGGIVD